MASDSTPGTGTPHRHRSLPRVRVAPDFVTERQSSPSTRESADLGRSRPVAAKPDSPMGNNLVASFPLIFFGAGCIASAVFVLSEGGGPSIGRIPLWLPFLAVGLIALVGGTLSVFAEPDEPETEAAVAPPTPRVVPVPPRRPVPARPRLVLPPSPPPIPPPRPAPVERPAPRESPPMPSAVPESQPTVSPKAIPPAAAVPTAAPAVPQPSESPFVLDDSSSLLKELDRIEADVHSSRAQSGDPNPAAGPAPAKPSGAAPSPARGLGGGVAGLGRVGPARSTSGRLESEAPRSVMNCVGCGSAILDSGQPSQCLVCHEPLCSECRDRSRSEGKPNLCPLCSVLDTVHSRGPTAARPRPRT